MSGKMPKPRAVINEYGHALPGKVEVPLHCLLDYQNLKYRVPLGALFTKYPSEVVHL